MTQAETMLRRLAKALGALLVPAWALLMVGLGLAAAGGDWHYHGDGRARGFYHTHGHLGRHQHEGRSTTPLPADDGSADEYFDLPAATATVADIGPPPSWTPHENRFDSWAPQPVFRRPGRPPVHRLRGPPPGPVTANWMA